MTDVQQHQPGDLVNGHVLTQHPDGSMTWEPAGTPAPAGASEPAAKRPLWKRKAFIIPAAAVGVVILISAIASGANGESGTPAAEQPAKVEAPAAEPAEPEAMLFGDWTGKTVGEAREALEFVGFKIVTSPADAGDDWVIGSTDPAAAISIPKGSTVTLIATAPAPAHPSMQHEQAVREAQNYLNIMAFSRQGLIDQLSSEYGSQYPVDVATYAVDYLAPDWNAEAGEQAKQYLDVMPMSRDELFDQLTSAYGGQFTPEQATAGLAAVGY
ncbi:Ltp family lipoprotein [Agromyces sp. MMS24-JH15]|uniref:Ltp family lipoprotein n=1 Tax=Agromyces sp. MMS24-JH15 TaxID=3243765 RepID=UPI003749B29B